MSQFAALRRWTVGWPLPWIILGAALVGAWVLAHEPYESFWTYLGSHLTRGTP